MLEKVKNWFCKCESTTQYISEIEELKAIINMFDNNYNSKKIELENSVNDILDFLMNSQNKKVKTISPEIIEKLSQLDIILKD